MTRATLLRLTALATLCTTGLLVPAEAAAFCGFYVSGADSKLYNDATMVVLMRDGTRTVLAMQNNYQGPPQDFALVVPVPVILKEKDVKTLPEEVFARIDALAAPRLVEYWEEDPCAPEVDYNTMPLPSPPAESVATAVSRRKARDLGVTIEAKFAVGEYQILILGAKDSTGLDLWLRQNGYKIPEGADAVLRPYVAAGMKFFVARVDIARVKRSANNQTMLSPLRFHYDSETFSLPVRLGLLNTHGKQDLIVHVLARETRYELANYRNVAIPTNLDVTDRARDNFAGFYAALFDRTLAGSTAVVVTEYAWAAGSCDPCPQAPLTLEELTTLGADVLPSYADTLGRRKVPTEMTYNVPSQFVLTRLHARYGRENLGEDLVFQAAPPIEGGREVRVDGQLEIGAKPSSYANNFQARYIIRHPWTGPVTCDDPRRGVWGGPPAGTQQPTTRVARDLAFAPRDAALTTFLTAELADAKDPLPPGPIPPPAVDRKAGINTSSVPTTQGCARCDRGDEPAIGLLGVALLGLARRRRR